MNIPGATPVAAPGGPAITSTRAGGDSAAQLSTFVNNLPADLLDAVRAQAREASYPNTTTERAMIHAIDEAAFDQVREIERHMTREATVVVEHARATTKNSEELTQRLDALVTQLRRGVATATLAGEYKTLMAQAHGALSKLSAAERNAEFWRVKVADPYAHTQKVLALMPRSSGVLIDPTPYLQ